MAAADQPKLVLWNHSNLAVCGWRVELYLELAGIPYEVKFVDLGKGEQKTEEFLALNHRGKVPVLQDLGNGVVLSESLAILNYLSQTYGNPKNLAPSANPKQLARAQELIFRWYNYLSSTSFEVASMLYGAPVAEDAPAKRLAELRIWEEKYLVHEDGGADRKWFVTDDQMSIPDILLLGEIHLARLGGLDLEKAGLKRLAAFWNRAFEKPEVQKTSIVPAHEAIRNGTWEAKGGLPDLYSKLY